MTGGNPPAGTDRPLCSRVPASLERKGSVRAFWASRAFRLYPLYLFAIAAAIALSLLGIGWLRGADKDPATSALTQLLMLSNLLNGPNVPNVVWTPAFEMVFYLLITALFVCRVHRHSAVFAGGFAVGAMALGGLLPLGALSASALGTRNVAVIADAAITASRLLRAQLPLRRGARAEARPPAGPGAAAGHNPGADQPGPSAGSSVKFSPHSGLIARKCRWSRVKSLVVRKFAAITATDASASPMFRSR